MWELGTEDVDPLRVVDGGKIVLASSAVEAAVSRDEDNKETMGTDPRPVREDRQLAVEEQANNAGLNVDSEDGGLWRPPIEETIHSSTALYCLRDRHI